MLWLSAVITSKTRFTYHDMWYLLASMVKWVNGVLRCSPWEAEHDAFYVQTRDIVVRQLWGAGPHFSRHGTVELTLVSLQISADGKLIRVPLSILSGQNLSFIWSLDLDVIKTHWGGGTRLSLSFLPGSGVSITLREATVKELSFSGKALSALSSLGRICYPCKNPSCFLFGVHAVSPWIVAHSFDQYLIFVLYSSVF